MNAHDPRNEMIHQMRKHQKLMGLLYEVYARRFPEIQGFCREMMMDHQAYADLLLMLAGKVDGQVMTYNQNEFNAEAVAYTSDYVLYQLLRAMSEPDLSGANAVGIARSLEQSGIARDFYKGFHARTPEMKQELTDVEAHVNRHFQTLQQRSQGVMQAA